MANDGNHAATVLMSFMLGAVTGAAIALLYAPGPGDETRRRLAEKARESRERASKAAQDSKEFLNRQKETLSSAVEKGREAFKQARKETS
jgi:gas vesicle protein